MDHCENDIKVKNITLVLTHSCNLNCVYCYEHNKNRVVMSYEKIIEIIDKEMSMNDGTDMVEFDFFGGEPLLEFENIKKSVEYTLSKNYSKDYIFFITTNGTILSDEQKKWFSSYKDYVQMGLSLDGNRKMHNLNRCNSFDVIDLSFFKETYPDQDVKMTISQLTLPMLAEGVTFCHEQGFKVACNLAYGINWDSEENKKTFEEQLYSLVEYYLAHPDIKPCAILDYQRIKHLTTQNDKNYRHCGAGYAMRAYDCNGECYPCQFFLPLSVGQEKARQSLSFDFSTFELNNDQVDDNCRDCLLRNVCPTCYGNNYASTGNVYRRDMRLCNMNKIQFRAIAYFAAKRFEAGQMSDVPENAEKAAILKAAMEILQLI